MLPLLALLNTAEATEPPISCAPAQHELTDQSCLTQAALSKELGEVFPGKKVRIEALGDRGSQGNRFVIDIANGPLITAKFLEKDAVCMYATDATYPAIWYPSLENLRDQKVPHFKPETEVIDVDTIAELERTLIFQLPHTNSDGQHARPTSIDFDNGQDPFVSTYDEFLDMIGALRTAINVGHLSGWGHEGFTDRIQKVAKSGVVGDLSRDHIKRTIIDSDNFKELSPEGQKVFTDYAEGRGPIIWALSRVEPIARQCSGSPIVGLDFYQ